jgi:hypothetical protein
MQGLSALVPSPVRPITPGVSGGAVDRFADLAAGLERAATAVARLDTRFTGHPLAPAWLAYPARGRPPASRSRRAGDRPLASGRNRRRRKVSYRSGRGNHRPGSDLRGRPPCARAVARVRQPDASSRRQSGWPQPRCRGAIGLRLCSAPRLASMPGSTGAADARHCAPRLPFIGKGGVDVSAMPAADRRQGARQRDTVGDGAPDSPLPGRIGRSDCPAHRTSFGRRN